MNYSISIINKIIKRYLVLVVQIIRRSISLTNKNLNRAFLIILLCCACSVELDNPNYLISGKSVFADDSTAEAAVIGIYSDMMAESGFAYGGIQSVSFLAGLSADEFKFLSTQITNSEFYNLSLSPNNGYIAGLWNSLYESIYMSNSILEGLQENSAISPHVRKPFEGEAYFIRAFSYFYLVNLFGDVPMALTTDYEANRLLERSSKHEIYDQIVQDLKIAIEYLPADYSTYGSERIRPNRYAALAFLARTYLYLEQWALAEETASLVIDQTGMYELVAHDEVFLKNSREAIWQLMPVRDGINTSEGSLLILTSTPRTVSMNQNLVEAFEPMDTRRVQWVSYYETYPFSYKYKIKEGNNLLEYSMVLRLAEQFLIRAEARVNQGKLEDGLSDLNKIRSRSNASLVQSNNVESALEAIQNERRLELFNEWGHRWLDLKRTDRAIETLSFKPGWQSTDLFYPIPEQELLRNPNMTPNDGY